MNFTPNFIQAFFRDHPVLSRFVKGLVAAGVGAAAGAAVTFFANPPDDTSGFIVAVGTAVALAVEKWAQKFGQS